MCFAFEARFKVCCVKLAQGKVATEHGCDFQSGTRTVGDQESQGNVKRRLWRFIVFDGAAT